MMLQEKASLLPVPYTTFKKRRNRPFRFTLYAILACVTVLFLCNMCIHVFANKAARFKSCALDRFDDSALYASPMIAPVPVEEYLERRDRLAQALVQDGHDAFIVEPGFTELYYANLSSFKWESWEPEERPFLLVITPITVNGKTIANATFVTPAFELQRAIDLHLPNAGAMQTVIWQEHESPYDILEAHLRQSVRSKGTINVVLDEEMRLFIVEGISSISHVQPISINSDQAQHVNAVKQVKSEREIELLRAVNTLTVQGIRAVQRCVPYGVSELDISQTLDAVMRSAGMEPFFDLVLVGEHGACPHCSSSENKLLGPDEFILIDAGAHLYGYSSDVARTFLPELSRPKSKDAVLSPKLQRMYSIWKTVLDAQAAAWHTFRPNATAASVDIAARQVIEKAGLGHGFTHRLGHSLGIKAHESPYLNKGNTNVTLLAGQVFTAEPGVYLPGDLGVRHEDIYRVSSSGEAEILSGTLATGMWDP